jgi:dihydrolipoamide dehydrogenase
MKQHVLVIGGGPAGITAAKAAALGGAEVTLVSDGPLGGRAGWHSLLPSKIWLSVADALSQIMVADQVGLNVGGPPEVDIPLVLDRIRETALAWNWTREAELEELGVNIIIGQATFSSPHSVLVQKKLVSKKVEIPADRFIVATGSVPHFPAGMEPDGTHIIAPRLARHLDRFPRQIIVIGAGPTGCEFVYLFNRLGLAVTWIYDQPGILPGYVPHAGEFLGRSLDSWGVQRAGGTPVTRIEKQTHGVLVHLADGSQYAAEMAFIATGRKPDLAELNLEVVGLDPYRPFELDAFGRTNREHIYAAGDAAGNSAAGNSAAGTPLVANRALAQAWVAGHHAAGQSPPPFRAESIVAAVYTNPQVAQVGQLSVPGAGHVRLPLENGLQSHLLPEAEGFIELAYDPETGRLLGAVAVGPQAADMLAPVAVAIHTQATLAQMASLFPAYPTWTELPFIAIRKAWQQNLDAPA